MGQLGYRRGAGQLRPMLGKGRWFRASNAEEQAFLVEVRPTITDYWRSPVPLASTVRPSNQGSVTTNEERVSPNDDFTPTCRTTAEIQVINTDQTTASALGTTHRCSVRASPRLDRGGVDRRSASIVIHHTIYTGWDTSTSTSRTTRQCSPKTTA